MPRALRILGAAAVLALASSLLGAGSAVALDDPDPAAPVTAVGECQNLTLAQTEEDSLPVAAVDCATTHTALTVAVATLPDAVTWDSAATTIGKAVYQACTPAVADLVGANPLLDIRSQYTWVWYAPTAEQKAAGARWISCHLVVREDNRLGPLPNPAPRLSKKMPNSIATCVTGKYAYTTCADTHAWRSSYAFYVTGKATTRNVDKAANRVCPKHVTSRKWLRSDWDVPGKRFIVACYSKTTH
jgi:hypothetical protein